MNWGLHLVCFTDIGPRQTSVSTFAGNRISAVPTLSLMSPSLQW